MISLRYLRLFSVLCAFIVGCGLADDDVGVHAMQLPAGEDVVAGDPSKIHEAARAHNEVFASYILQRANRQHNIEAKLAGLAEVEHNSAADSKVALREAVERRRSLARDPDRVWRNVPEHLYTGYTYRPPHSHSPSLASGNNESDVSFVAHNVDSALAPPSAGGGDEENDEHEHQEAPVAEKSAPRPITPPVPRQEDAVEPPTVVDGKAHEGAGHVDSVHDDSEDSVGDSETRGEDGRLEEAKTHTGSRTQEQPTRSKTQLHGAPPMSISALYLAFVALAGVCFALCALLFGRNLVIPRSARHMLRRMRAPKERDVEV